MHFNKILMQQPRGGSEFREGPFFVPLCHARPRPGKCFTDCSRNSSRRGTHVVG